MIFGWQGWRLLLPDEWNPVKLHGNFEKGYALLSDIHRARLGIRWSTPGKRFDSKAWARQVLVDEIGQLAANEAQECKCDEYLNAWLYSEADPPGRDVWLAMSRTSGRTIEIVHHVYKEEESKIEFIREGLHDSAPDGELVWAAFDLNCRTASGWRLQSHQLNAGDLSLTFSRKSERITVRQIAVARLALKRMKIEQWLDQQIRRHLQQYRQASGQQDCKIESDDGRVLAGVLLQLDRKKRFMWNRSLSPMICAMALHDEKRDRLVFIEAENQIAADEFARSIGSLSEKVMC